MQLILESGKKIENPSSEEIASSLLFEEFAILANGTESSTYLQFAESKTPPFALMLEYQVDSLDNHFTAVSPPLTMEAIIMAFQKYATKDDSWKSDFQWERLKL